jgi:hypothetical protein
VITQGVEPRSRLEEAGEPSTLTLRKLRAVFELRHEVDVQTLGDHPGGWHTNQGQAGALCW